MTSPGPRQRSRRIKLAGVALAVVALAAVAVATFKRSGIQASPPWSKPENPLDQARRRIEPTWRTMTIEALGLTTRMPPSMTCAVGPISERTTCEQGSTYVEWSLVTPSAIRPRPAKSIDEHYSPKEVREYSGDGEFWVGDADIAGFRGFWTYTHWTRSPEINYSFQGWKALPGKGIGELQIYSIAKGPDPMLGLAVALTTSAGPTEPN